MTPRRARFRPPAPGRTAVPSRPVVGLPLLLAAAATLGACSAQTDVAADDASANVADTADTSQTTDSTTESGGDAGDPSSSAGDTLSFGDPVDDGFAEVIDLEIEPEETPEADLAVLSVPDEVVQDVADQLEVAPIAAGEEILDVVDVVDTEAEVAADRDGRSRNSSGELTILDDAASLACAHIEVALTHLDEGNTSIAIERIWAASQQAASSNISTIQSWEAPLAETVADGEVSDLAPLIGFISVCAEGGYEL